MKVQKLSINNIALLETSDFACLKKERKEMNDCVAVVCLMTISCMRQLRSVV